MNSEDGDASKYELLHLIYLHLKENGYKKAANVLRKHVTQNEAAAAAAATLHDIYKSWVKTSDSVKTKEVADIDATLVKAPDPEKLETYEDAVSPDSTAKNGGETVDPKPVELAGAPTNTGLVSADSQAPKDSNGSQNGVRSVSVVISDVTALQDGPASEVKSGSSDDSTEQEVPVLQKKMAGSKLMPTEVSATAVNAGKAEGSSEDSDSEDEAPILEVPVMPKLAAAAAPAKQTPRKGGSRGAVKPGLVTVNLGKAGTKAPASEEKADSSESGSSDESESEEEKAPPLMTAAANSARTAALVAAEKLVGGATASPVKATPRITVTANVDSESSETDDEVTVKKVMLSPTGKAVLITPQSKPPALSQTPEPSGKGKTTDSSTSEEEAELTKTPVSSKAVLATLKTAVLESGSEDSSEDGGAPPAVEAVKTMTDPGSPADAGNPVTPTSPVSKEEEGLAPSPLQEVTEPKSPEIVPSEDTAPDQPIPAPGEPTTEDLSPGEEEISQAVLEPAAAAEGSTPKSKKSKEGEKKAKKKKKKEKKKRDSAPSEETSAPDDPAKAAEEVFKDEEVSDIDTSPQDAKSETPQQQPVTEDAPAEPAVEAPLETVAPLAKRKRAEEDTELPAKKTKKKKKERVGWRLKLPRRKRRSQRLHLQLWDWVNSVKLQMRWLRRTPIPTQTLARPPSSCQPSC
ncbi:hypothetical protein GJAV_G00124880 [Gymnothorax javanicus]|nr:hypothetical protein GJAV_G00124880 [Gymnothorax javanicus]